MGPEPVVGQSFGQDVHPIPADDQIDLAALARQGMDRLEDLLETSPSKIDPFVNRVDDPQGTPPTGTVQGFVFLSLLPPFRIIPEGTLDIMPDIGIQQAQAAVAGSLSPAGKIIVLVISLPVG